MRITVDDVQVLGRREPMLEIDHLEVSTGECVLVAGDPWQGHTALALVATGRLAPFTGTVVLVEDDGTTSTEPARLREVSAVVDLPGITEPDDPVPVGTVVAEGLAFAHRPASHRAATEWLGRRAMRPQESERMDAVHGAVRTELLASLATERPDVRFLVLTLPDRHGGAPASWWSLAQELASRGYGVLVQCTPSAARDLGASVPVPEGEGSRRAAPVEAIRLTPPTAPAPATAPAPPARAESEVELTDPTRLFDGAHAAPAPRGRRRRRRATDSPKEADR
ncbi:hypothetical protein [Georgenia faecalis]|uniref:ABC transporter ATP-binding protein n=1 Tax=Georgenia faecalis TaxID=2483799 RepID=A0ABV9D9P0_9MICO|nr:hypothetical protein [Georgenia faecalis]